MKKFIVSLILVVLTAGTAFSQDLKLPALDNLKAKASEVVDVTMDKNMLNFASKFLSNKEPDDVEAKKLVSNLKGIYVRSFEFDKPGEYSMADVEPFRQQLKAPVWSKMVESHSKKDGEHVEVFLRMENGIAAGLVVIAAEAKELTLVHIDGPIDPAQLSSLGGQFGIPQVSVGDIAKEVQGSASSKRSDK